MTGSKGRSRVRRGSFGDTVSNVTEKSTVLTRGEKATAAVLSSASSALIVSVKIAVAVVTGSVAVASQSVYSVVTLVSAMITTLSLVSSRSEREGDLRPGGVKIRDIVAVVEAIIILVASAWIIVHAVRHALSSDSLGDLHWGVAAMIVSVVANAMAYLVLTRIGKEEDSVGLLATAGHSRVDMYGSAGVAIALAAIWAGRGTVPDVDLRWVDSVAAIVIAVLNIEAALDLILKSGGNLRGARFRSEDEKRIRYVIALHCPQVRGLRHMRTRRAGPFRFIDFHVMANPHLTAEDFQALRKKLFDSVKTHFLRSSVTVHVEPCAADCEGVCLSECFFTEGGMSAAHGRERIGQPCRGRDNT
ncbi:MAG: cation diffusion facilitator family transporter [Chloroflexota bacterium]